MAVGDVVKGLQSIATGSHLDIKPPTGQEWVLHNLYYGGQMDIKIYDGTNALKIDGDTAFGARLGCMYHATETQWVRITNTSGSTFLFGYDGIQTK